MYIAASSKIITFGGKNTGARRSNISFKGTLLKMPSTKQRQKSKVT